MAETEGHLDKLSEMRHLLRAVKTSTELAILARAPAELVNRLARVSGLLDAVSQLAVDAAPARELTTSLIRDALGALDQWRSWDKARSPAA
jgi:hypothetical protein